LALSACASVGPFVWADDLSDVADAPRVCKLGPGDVIDVRVFHEEGMSGKVRVRADGMISVPFLGDVRAAGMAPGDLSREVETGLKQFIKNPVVTVVLEEPRAAQVPVLGEVAHPGLYPLADAGMLTALASAGGLTQFASRDGIFVIRQGSSPQRIRFRVEDISRGGTRSATFRLQPGDSIVVE
ncbi:MAG: polysaccharide biosynthesis/export family protein, partial [Myxococcales bacterium]